MSSMIRSNIREGLRWFTAFLFGAVAGIFVVSAWFLLGYRMLELSLSTVRWVAAFLFCLVIIIFITHPFVQSARKSTF